MSNIKDLDLVILTEDIQGTEFETGQPIIISSGRVGTVVMEYDGMTFEVEFIDSQGVTLAMETISSRKLRLAPQLPPEFSSFSQIELKS